MQLDTTRNGAQQQSQGRCHSGDGKDCQPGTSPGPAGPGPSTTLQTLLTLRPSRTPEAQPVPSASHLKPAQVWENCELTKGENKLYFFFKSLQNSIVCLCPNPQEPHAERSNLISQGTDITIWYQFSIRLLLFRNCFSCSRKRALPGSHRAQGALAARRPHVTGPWGHLPDGHHTKIGRGNGDSGWVPALAHPSWGSTREAPQGPPHPQQQGWSIPSRAPRCTTG